MSTEGEQQGIRERFDMAVLSMPMYIRSNISELQRKSSAAKLDVVLLACFSAGVQDCIEYTESVVENEARGRAVSDAVDSVAELLHHLHEASKVMI